MELFKRLWKEHKKEIVISGLMVIGAVAGYIIVTKRMPKEFVDDFAGKAVISWDPNSGAPVSLEKVREFLTLNSDMNSKFAIFREGTNLDEYCIILLN